MQALNPQSPFSGSFDKPLAWLRALAPTLALVSVVFFSGSPKAQGPGKQTAKVQPLYYIEYFVAGESRVLPVIEANKANKTILLQFEKSRRRKDDPSPEEKKWIQLFLGDKASVPVWGIKDAFRNGGVKITKDGPTHDTLERLTIRSPAVRSSPQPKEAEKGAGHVSSEGYHFIWDLSNPSQVLAFQDLPSLTFLFGEDVTELKDSQKPNVDFLKVGNEIKPPSSPEKTLLIYPAEFGSTDIILQYPAPLIDGSPIERLALDLKKLNVQPNNIFLLQTWLRKNFSILSLEPYAVTAADFNRLLKISLDGRKGTRFHTKDAAVDAVSVEHNKNTYYLAVRGAQREYGDLKTDVTNTEQNGRYLPGVVSFIPGFYLPNNEKLQVKIGDKVQEIGTKILSIKCPTVGFILISLNGEHYYVQQFEVTQNQFRDFLKATEKEQNTQELIRWSAEYQQKVLFGEKEDKNDKKTNFRAIYYHLFGEDLSNKNTDLLHLFWARQLLQSKAKEFDDLLKKDEKVDAKKAHMDQLRLRDHLKIAKSRLDVVRSWTSESPMTLVSEEAARRFAKWISPSADLPDKTFVKAILTMTERKGTFLLRDGAPYSLEQYRGATDAVESNGHTIYALFGNVPELSRGEKGEQIYGRFWFQGPDSKKDQRELKSDDAERVGFRLIIPVKSLLQNKQ